LTEVYSLNPIPPSCNSGDPFSDNIYINAMLYVPEEVMEAYGNAEYWKKFQKIKDFASTGINGIEADGNGRRKAYYDINGRRLNFLKKGLNIINGKKVIVK